MEDRTNQECGSNEYMLLDGMGQHLSTRVAHQFLGQWVTGLNLAAYKLCNKLRPLSPSNITYRKY